MRGFATGISAGLVCPAQMRDDSGLVVDAVLPFAGDRQLPRRPRLAALARRPNDAFSRIALLAGRPSRPDDALTRRPRLAALGRWQIRDSIND